MGQLSIQTETHPQVVIERAEGNLEVKGWDRSEVLVKSAEIESTSLQDVKGEIRLSGEGDMLVRLPQEAQLRIQRVEGNLRVKYLESQLDIEQVEGNLELRDADDTRIGSVEGNLDVKRLTGSLQAQTVTGNAWVRDVEGACTLEEVSGNLELRDVEGDVRAVAAGNANLRLTLLLGSRFQISAGGNLICTVPEESSLRAELTSGAQKIRLRLPEGKSILSQASYTLTLGSGQADMKLTAGGTLEFESRDGEWTETGGLQIDLEEQINDQIASEMEAHAEMLKSQMEVLHERLASMQTPLVDTERIMEQARAASERATERAQEKLRRAQERMQRKVDAAARRAEVKARAAERRGRPAGGFAWNFEWRPSTARQGEPKPQVSDEERLMILRMLQEKKISVEEAEQLLAALEGRTA